MGQRKVDLEKEKDKDDKGAESTAGKESEGVSYCQERRMGNGHRDGWRLISSLQ